MLYCRESQEEVVEKGKLDSSLHYSAAGLFNVRQAVRMPSAGHAV